jgi:hypothetical protein
LRPRKHQHDLNLNEIEGASTLLNDDEATEFGPLTEAALEQERKRSQLDPSFPRRPLRLLPVGQVEKDTPESKAFRRFALDNDAQINLLPNPKQAGKLSWERTLRALQTRDDASRDHRIVDNVHASECSSGADCKSKRRHHQRLLEGLHFISSTRTQRERSLCQRNGLSKESWHSEYSRFILIAQCLASRSPKSRASLT